LSGDQAADAQGVVGHVPAHQQKNDDNLRHDHDPAGEPDGPFDAELHRQGADAEFLVAFDGLEVVQRHDPVGAQAVQDGKDQDARVRQAGRHDRRPREPGKAFISESAGGITEPAVLFQSERGGRIGPGEGEAHESGNEHPGADQPGHKQRYKGTRRFRWPNPIVREYDPTGSGGPVR